MKKEERKSPYVENGPVKKIIRENTVNVRDIAADIMEMFEDVLERYGIIVPDEDRGLDNDQAAFYGMTYGRLEDAVSGILTDVVTSIDPSVRVKDAYEATTGNYSKYFDISSLKEQHGEFSQMLTINTIHVSEETAKKLDADCDGTRAVDHWMPPVYEKNGFGWFIFIDADVMEEYEAEGETIPADLKAVLTYAANCGCQWLCLDADAPQIPELPVYQRGGEENE